MSAVSETKKTLVGHPYKPYPELVIDNNEKTFLK
jgi:hypothetical protein